MHQSCAPEMCTRVVNQSSGSASQVLSINCLLPPLSLPVTGSKARAPSPTLRAQTVNFKDVRPAGDPVPIRIFRVQNCLKHCLATLAIDVLQGQSPGGYSFILLLIPSIPIISIMVRMEWYDGTGGSCSPPIRRTLITYALLCIWLYFGFCSTLDFALLCSLLCFVFCSALYFVLYLRYSYFVVLSDLL